MFVSCDYQYRVTIVSTRCVCDYIIIIYIVTQRTLDHFDFPVDPSPPIPTMRGIADRFSLPDVYIQQRKPHRPGITKKHDPGEETKLFSEVFSTYWGMEPVERFAYINSIKSNQSRAFWIKVNMYFIRIEQIHLF
jgi:hypothetical protein